MAARRPLIRAKFGGMADQDRKQGTESHDPDFPEKFLEFYNSVHPDSVDTDCERIFGCDIDELERAFWEDAGGRPALPK